MSRRDPLALLRRLRAVELRLARECRDETGRAADAARDCQTAAIMADQRERALLAARQQSEPPESWAAAWLEASLQAQELVAAEVAAVETALDQAQHALAHSWAHLEVVESLAATRASVAHKAAARRELRARMETPRPAQVPWRDGRRGPAGR